MNREIFSQTIEDYLKVIFKLTEEGKTASTTSLASMLSVSPASVSEMLQKLSNAPEPLVDHKKYQGVTLTAIGVQAAIQIIRRHRLLETFLSEVMRYPLEKIHDEACVLEHYISEDFEEGLARILGEPSFTPHGEPIPSTELIFPISGVKPLSTCKPSEKILIKQVPDTDAALLRYLSENNLIPGTQASVIIINPFDSNMTLKLNDGLQIVLGPSITAKIFVQDESK